VHIQVLDDQLGYQNKITLESEPAEGEKENDGKADACRVKQNVLQRAFLLHALHKVRYPLPEISTKDFAPHPSMSFPYLHQGALQVRVQLYRFTFFMFCPKLILHK